jgi:hypothetical protein
MEGWRRVARLGWIERIGPSEIFEEVADAIAVRVGVWRCVGGVGRAEVT